MAATAKDDDDMITGINVTPLVDVVLVLLVILMVTANYISSQSIPLDLPKGATGEATPVTISVSIDAQGRTFLDAEPVDVAGLRGRVRAAHEANPDVRAVIAADGKVRHEEVVKVMDLLRQENVTKFAINVEPEDLETRT